MSRPAEADRVETLLLSIGLAFSGVALAVMVLVEARLLTRPSILVTGAVVVLAAGAAARGAWQRASRTAWRDWIVVAAIVAFGAVAFAPPAESLVDAGDASVYAAVRRIIATDGGLGGVDPVLARLTPDDLGDLFSRDRRPPPLLNYFPGGIQAHDDGTVEASFFHLSPALMAAADVGIGGRAGDGTNAVFGILALLFVFGLARRLSGSSWSAAAASTFVGLSFGQMWFARLPTSEVVAEAFVVAAVFGMIVASDIGSRLAALAGGLAAGLAAFARIDTALMVTAPLVAIAIARMIVTPGDRSRLKPFVVAGLLTSAWAAAHAWWFASAYTERILYLIFRAGWTRAGDPVVTSALIVLAVLLWWMRGRFGVVRRLAAPAAALVIVGAAAWAVTHRAEVLAHPFVAMVGWPAAALMALGVAALFPTRDAERALPIAAVLLAAGFVYLQSPRDVAGMPMLLRRYIPVLLPIGMVVCAHGLSLAARSKPGRVLAVAAAVAMALTIGTRSAMLWTAEPYRGVRLALEGAAGAIPAGALTFVHPRTPSHLGLALRYETGRDVLLVTGPRRANAVAEIAREALVAGREVRVAAPQNLPTGADLSALDFRGLQVVSVADLSLRYAVFAPSDAALPVRLQPATPAVDVYEVLVPPAAGVPLPVQADIGSRDFGWIASGFHGSETMQGASARWTDGAARIVLPPMDLPAEALVRGRITLSCRFAVGWPDAIAMPAVTLEIGGEPVITFAPVSRGFAEYAVRLDDAALERLRRGAVIGLRSGTFVPAQHGFAGDSRALGIGLDWIRVDIAPETPPGL